MNVIEKLKTEAMRLRKERSPLAPSIQFALSEIEKVGKNNGNRPTTNDEAIKVLQKLIATLEDNISKTDDIGRKVHMNYEKNILSSVLPKLASDDEIIDFLEEFFNVISDESPKKGDIMRALRNKFGALVDMKRAGQIATEKFGV
jgi:uncharacterized protein YqeY